VGCALGSVAASPGAAQVARSPAGEVSPLLAADHWAVQAARRAEALGLAPGYLPPQTGVSRHVVQAALLTAVERAAIDAPHLVEVAEGWSRRFEEEFGDVRDRNPSPGIDRLGSRIGLDVVREQGHAAPGSGIFPWNLTGATALGDRTEALASGSLALGVSPYLSLLAEPTLGRGGVAWNGWEVAAGAGAFRLGVGRQPVGYGYAATGGVVLTGAEPVTRIELATSTPFRLPWLLGHLGPLSFHAFGSRLAEPRHPGEPYLWGMSGLVQPHPRLTLSVHRASIMGGDSTEVPLTARTFLRTFVGHNLLGFENEVVGGQIRVRLPTEALLPVTVYTEWGAEDAAGAWRDVPGRVYGVFLPALPRLPQVAVGAEYVSFAGACCGNPPWYRHSQHTGNWAVDRQPLGHPLGGQGRQATLLSQVDVLQSRLRADVRLFARSRHAENLFVPGRAGDSNGLDVRVRARTFSRGDIVTTLFHEAGGGWRETVASAGFHAYF
jgi:hypothetical protein